MAIVTLTRNLKKYFPETQLEVAGHSLKEILEEMERIRPHFLSYILEDNNRIRRHVNIFIDGELLMDKTHLDVVTGARTRVHIMQALSGG